MNMSGSEEYVEDEDLFANWDDSESEEEYIEETTEDTPTEETSAEDNPDANVDTDALFDNWNDAEESEEDSEGEFVEDSNGESEALFDNWDDAEEGSSEPSESTEESPAEEDDDDNDDDLLQGVKTDGFFNEGTVSGLDYDNLVDSKSDDDDDDDLLLDESLGSDESSDDNDDDLLINKEDSIDLDLNKMVPLTERNKGKGLNTDESQRMGSLISDLAIQCGKVTFDWGRVKFEDIFTDESIKKARLHTGIGLQQSVKEMGILCPIHVMFTEAFADWVEAGHAPEDYKEPRYRLIDGYRRMRAALAAGQQETNAIIWDFDEKDAGAEVLLQFYLILNKTARRDWDEIYNLLKELNRTTDISSGKKDSLLMLEQGDSMKLQDIMTCDYQDVIDTLLSNKKTLQQCYQMLQKKRAEEDTLAKEESEGISAISKEAKDAVGGVQDISSEDVSELTSNLLKELETVEDTEELSDEDFGDLIGSDEPDPKQKVGKRHPLDPELRNAVLTRDHFTCQASGNGVDGGLPLNLALEILNVHHLVPVYLGGTDTIDNLITLDVTSHTMVHILERNSGKLNITKDKFDGLPKEKQVWFKKVLKIAKIAVDARKKKGVSVDDIKAESRASAQFQMPGQLGDKNREALKESNNYSKEAETVKK